MRLRDVTITEERLPDVKKVGIKWKEQPQRKTMRPRGRAAYRGRASYF
jgi:hypothetical protein